MNLGGMLKGYVTAVQSDGAEALAQAARAAGAGAFVHVSAIGADPHSRSRYGRTKGEGEARVLAAFPGATIIRSEEHTSELQSLMRISYAVFCLQKKKRTHTPLSTHYLTRIK